ncbi:MAG TPA: DUF1003 domain-containing protein [Stellaceae bacterium]|jgi:uncharacterized membrane protein|nr:DUF1003 domain-containing protein [Stellaceae bacterium]
MTMNTNHAAKVRQEFYRFHLPHVHLASVFGDDWFALKAEGFARFFGTPIFLISQTIFVLIWMAANVVGLTHFDIYPFILLNLAFSLQAAYAAPLILLAQTRQADRDKMQSLADAEHREVLHREGEERSALVAKQTAMLVEMLQQNTDLTEKIRALTERVEALTRDVHSNVCSSRASG